jgi:hypothetical protein
LQSEHLLLARQRFDVPGVFIPVRRQFGPAVIAEKIPAIITSPLSWVLRLAIVAHLLFSFVWFSLVGNRRIVAWGHCRFPSLTKHSNLASLNGALIVSWTGDACFWYWVTSMPKWTTKPPESLSYGQQRPMACQASLRLNDAYRVESKETRPLVQSLDTACALHTA